MHPEHTPRHLPAPEARAALAWLHTARFAITAAGLDDLPPPALPEIAFVGRSNVGKSTAINTLTQHKRLAFSSRTPGRTQHINLFAVGRQRRAEALFADLPGYGYAAVPQQARLRWQQVMAAYLRRRSNLVGVVLLADPRRGVTPLDDILLEVLRERVENGLRLMVLLTKSDKLNRSAGARALSIARVQVGGATVRLFSAPQRIGVDDTALDLYRWCDADATDAAAGIAPARADRAPAQP